MEIYKQCVQEHDEEFANCKTKLQIKSNSPNYKEFTKIKVLKVQILYILMKPPF